MHIILGNCHIISLCCFACTKSLEITTFRTFGSFQLAWHLELLHAWKIQHVEPLYAQNPWKIRAVRTFACTKSLPGPVLEASALLLIKHASTGENRCEPWRKTCCLIFTTKGLKIAILRQVCTRGGSAKTSKIRRTLFRGKKITSVSATLTHSEIQAFKDITCMSNFWRTACLTEGQFRPFVFFFWVSKGGRELSTEGTNFSTHTPPHGRPSPHRTVFSDPKSESLCSFLLPERGQDSGNRRRISERQN